MRVRLNIGRFWYTRSKFPSNLIFHNNKCFFFIMTFCLPMRLLLPSVAFNMKVVNILKKMVTDLNLLLYLFYYMRLLDLKKTYSTIF